MQIVNKIYRKREINRDREKKREEDRNREGARSGYRPENNTY